MEGFDKLDRGHGSGARSATEDFIASETFEQKNRFSTSRTKFNAYEADSAESRWKRLKKTNDRKRKGEDSEFFRRAERLQDTTLFCDVLELANHVRARVMQIVESFDFDSKKYGGKSYEKIILVIINLVHDTTLGDGDSYEDRIIYDESYQELMEMSGLDSTERQRLRQNVRELSEIV